MIDPLRMALVDTLGSALQDLAEIGRSEGVVDGSRRSVAVRVQPPREAYAERRSD